MADSLLIDAAELSRRLAAGEPVTILDVRGEKARRESGTQIAGSIRVPLSRWHIDESWPRDRLTVLYCSCPGDVSSLRAAERLRAAGFTQAVALRDGFEGWVRSGGTVTR